MKNIVKNGFSLVLIVLILGTILSAGALAASDYTVSLSSASATVMTGDNVIVSVDVTGDTNTAYNAFYGAVTYDSGKVSFNRSASTLNGFTVDNGTDGVLKVVKTGVEIDITTNPDFSLAFVAKSSGTAAFTITGAKIDAAINAEYDAPSANIGIGQVNITVTGEYYSGDDDVLPPEQTTSDISTDTSISGDTATVTVGSNELEKATKGADENTQLVVSADVPDNAGVDTVTATLPADGMKAAADSGVSLKIATSVGDIVLSNAALKDLTSDGGDIEVTVTQIDENTTRVIVTVDGKVVDEIKGGVKVAIPAKDGQVAVLVKDDGTELIHKSVVEDGQAYVLLDGSAKIEIVDNSKGFKDVLDNDWFKGAVDFASSHEFFYGVSETEFAPGMDMTRAMMVTVLYRLEGAPDCEGVNSFNDVDLDTWYSNAVDWATEAGIVKGYDDETFGTEDSITREQMAVMFYRYAIYADMDTTASKSLNDFTDGGDVSPWAKDAMKWAVAVGLFQGDDTGALNPTNNATRAEVATLFQRMVELMVK